MFKRSDVIVYSHGVGIEVIEALSKNLIVVMQLPYVRISERLINSSLGLIVILG